MTRRQPGWVVAHIRYFIKRGCDDQADKALGILTQARAAASLLSAVLS